MFNKIKQTAKSLTNSVKSFTSIKGVKEATKGADQNHLIKMREKLLKRI